MIFFQFYADSTMGLLCYSNTLKSKIEGELLG